MRRSDGPGTEVSGTPPGGGTRPTRGELERVQRCPLCGASPEAYTVLTARGDRFAGERAVLCGRCGLVFLDPRLDPGALARYYRSDTFSREVRREDRPSAAALAYRDMRARRRWRFLEDAMPPVGRCLEVGCGAGNFLALLRDAGHEVVGIDPSTGYASHAQARGLEVTAGHFPTDLPAGPPFDVAFAFHVLEHVSDPLAFLAALRGVLRPGGLLALEYPDVALAARRRFLPHSYFERAHLFDFSERTLAAFLARAGFRVHRAWYEERVKPYDRNVLLLCEAAEPAEPAPWDPEEAARLAHALRGRLRASAPFMPLQPIWRRIKEALGRRR